jgi:phenylalanyl-tRNA synthetase beta subunit
MSDQLKETIADYGIENSLDAIIHLIEFGCLGELHKAVILAYLIPAKKYIAELDCWQRFRLEDCVKFTKVEVCNG